MGNETSRNMVKTNVNNVLYSIKFSSGEVIQPEKTTTIENTGRTPSLLVSSKPNCIAIEIILHCEKGDIGPLPISDLGSNETRSVDMWSVDLGRPKYCIVIMYRQQMTCFPQWSIKECEVKIVRREQVYHSKFRHLSPLLGGDAHVYSLTMSPYFTETQNVSYNGIDEVVIVKDD